jgi:hypothetical protein
MNEILGTTRRWIQQNALNGSSVTWGSDEKLRFTRELTVKDFEDLAMELSGKSWKPPNKEGEK